LWISDLKARISDLKARISDLKVGATYRSE
jgi:hypothetical protein